MHPFSLAQSIGYLAFLFGAAAFLQKNDRRLKFLNGTQCIFYALHFTLLGNLPAAGSLSVSAARSFVSIKTQSRWVAAFFLILNVVIGSMLVHNHLGWLAVAGGVPRDNRTVLHARHTDEGGLTGEHIVLAGEQHSERLDRGHDAGDDHRLREYLDHGTAVSRPGDSQRRTCGTRARRRR